MKLFSLQRLQLKQKYLKEKNGGGGGGSSGFCMSEWSPLCDVVIKSVTSHDAKGLFSKLNARVKLLMRWERQEFPFSGCSYWSCDLISCRFSTFPVETLKDAEIHANVLFGEFPKIRKPRFLFSIWGFFLYTCYLHKIIKIIFSIYFYCFIV